MKERNSYLAETDSRERHWFIRWLDFEDVGMMKHLCSCILFFVIAIIVIPFSMSGIALLAVAGANCLLRWPKHQA